MRRSVMVRFGILCLVVLWSFSSLSVFAASSATRSTSPPTMSNGSASPLLFGSNLSLYNSQDFFVTDSQTQRLAQQSGIRFMRFPDRGDRSLYLAAAQEIQTLGMTPLAILPYDNASADLQLVQDMNGVFGSSIVYYEYGNEQDLQGVDVTAYTASWNRVIPTIKQAATNANFIGPVNFQVNPSYIAIFAANAHPRPDEVSWHEYTCSASDSEATCLQNLSHWTQHIADVRTALQQAIGTTLPVLITEWNIDPNPPDSKLSDAAFVTQWTEQALSELAASNVFGSNEYVLSNNEYLAMISDASHTLNAQGQAFQGMALQQHPLPPSPTLPISSPGTTPSPTVTISPSPTLSPTGTVSPSPVSCSSSTSSTPTSTPTPSPTSPPVTATPTGTSTEDAEHEIVQPLPTLSVSPVPAPAPPATPAPTLSPLHVDATGQIVNAEDCPVPLVGVNMGNLYEGDAGVGNVDKLGLTVVQARIVWYKQHLPMNVVRVNFNATWWNSNVFVPKAHMHFRQWLEQYVAWQEQVGNYVELDGGPHFREPPCGGTITFCPSQNQARKDAAQSPDPFLCGGNIAPLVQAWTDLSALYANDPAILYDVWNEPTAQEVPDQMTYFADMNTLINTVRAHSPQSLIIVYGRGLRAMQEGRIPDYQQPNLVFDTHIYDGFQGTSPATGQHCSEPGGTHWTPQTHDLAALVTWAHSQQQGFLIDEWGGCYDEPAYHTALTTFAQAQGVGLVYFTADNLVTETHSGNQATSDPTNLPGLALNVNGQQVAATYQQMLNAMP